MYYNESNSEHPACKVSVTHAGRSMIEMLGVLAIIGVLSVGGIAGYSKAMMKFKINKTIDQISQIFANIQTLYAQQKGYGGLDKYIAIETGIIPKEMVRGASVFHAFAENYSAFVDVDPLYGPFFIHGNGRFVKIMFTGLPEEACVALATHDWENDIDGLRGIVIGDVTGIEYNLSLPDCTSKSIGNRYMACKGYLPISPNIAAKYCSKEMNVYHSFGIMIRK